jgi:hypothetical protein
MRAQYSRAMHACTAVMSNFLPHARVLAESFGRHHPGCQMTVLVVDGEESRVTEPFQILRPWDLGLDEKEIYRILTLFDGALPAGALRGALIRCLLEATSEPILFLDPDAQVFASLEEVGHLAAEHGVVLSPHLLRVPDRHYGFGGDHSLLLSGSFNSGLVAVGLGGKRFLDWWAPRLQRWTLLAPGDGYYGTQRWLDLVPAMFECHVLRDPGCNVMTLNAHERSLNSRLGHWYAGDGPLRLFHFGGSFDPERPYLSSRDYAPLEALLSEHPVMAELHRRYAEALLSSGWDCRAPLPAPLEVEPGLTLDQTMRAIYREALLESETSRGPEPPNPYVSGEAFIDWLRRPSDLRRNACMVSRYLQARWSRDDLAPIFPDLPGHDATRYLAWARGPEGTASGIPGSLAEAAEAPIPPVPVTTRGVNVVLSDEGLSGFVGRSVARHLRLEGEHVAEIVYPRARAARVHVSSRVAAAAIGDVTIICLPAPLMAAFDYDLGVLFKDGRWVVTVAVDSIWSTHDLMGFDQIADEVWCWDVPTADRIREACGVHVEALPFPAGAPVRDVEDGGLVCWADLVEPGHSAAILEAVERYLQGSQFTSDRLHAHVSGWEADPVVAETLWGFAQFDKRVAVHRDSDWLDAFGTAHTVLSLGAGIGPVEAEALHAGLDVITANGSRLCSRGRAARFGPLAADRLRALRSALTQN